MTTATLTKASGAQTDDKEETDSSLNRTTNGRNGKDNSTTAAGGDAGEEPALMHRSLVERPHLVASASGSWIRLADSPSFPGGHDVLDGCAGAAVSVLGHGNAEVSAAIAAQLEKVAFIHTGAYTTSSAEELAKFLLEQGGSHDEEEKVDKKKKKNPFGFSKVVLVGSGSEATDSAMKLARQYFFERDGGSGGSNRRTRWIVRRQGYHGNTIGAMSVSSNVSRRIPYEDALVLPPGDKVRFVNPAFAYHGRKRRVSLSGSSPEDGNRDGDNDDDDVDEYEESEDEYAARLVQELEDEILAAGPDTIMAFLGETVVGATSGCVAAPRGYFAGVRRVCDKYGILMILDEVMCGTGRTGSYFAFEQEGAAAAEVRPDMVTVGKGLSGGFAPLAAVLVHDRIVQVLREGSALYQHGHTYQAHAVGCAAALTVQRIMRRDRLVEACSAKGHVLESLLRTAFVEDAKYVGDIRGRGLFWSLEFVRCRKTRKTFKPAVRFGVRVQQRAFELGLAVYPGQGTKDGYVGDHVLLAPPLTISLDELEILVQRLKAAYCDVERSVDDEERGVRAVA